MKFSQFTEQNMRNIFVFKNHVENERLVPDLFLSFLALYEVKTSSHHLSFNIFWLSSSWAYNKNKKCKIQTVDPEICSILFFFFFFKKKSLAIVSPLQNIAYAIF